jgi:hypothetical protein
MANDKLAKNVQILQKEFVRRLGQGNTNLIAAPTPQVLLKIYESNLDLLKYALGDFGFHLGRYAQSLDIGHPDVVSILDGLLDDKQRFAQYCLELLKLAEYARSSNMNCVFPDLGQTLIREMVSKSVAKRLDGSTHNRSHVRLVADPDERNQIRLSKRTQNIDLAGVYKKGEEVWLSQPDSFKKFLRFDSAYEDEIRSAERKVKRYKELGCNSLANEIAKTIESFKENMEQSYYGFNRITMTNAAIILAKSAGHIYSAVHGRWTIRVDRRFFGEYNFETSLGNGSIFDPYENHIYQPRAYPFHVLYDIAPDSVKRTVEHLESFPEANNRPIFDHYGVIVPGIAYGRDGFYDEAGFYLKFQSEEMATRALDKTFIKGEYFYPVVVGEKDGKCYFICYWAEAGAI